MGKVLQSNMSQIINISVKRWKSLDLWILLLVWILVFIIGAKANARPMSLAMFISLIVWIGVECVVNLVTDAEREVYADFDEKEVTLRYSKKSWQIPYDQIKEVGKVMVLTQYEMEKGNYTVFVRTRWRRYVFSTPEKDYEKHLDFEETDLYRFYREFGRHGVKLC